MKSPFAVLRMEGHTIIIYIDDLINVGDTSDECCKNIDACINFLQYLGFTNHPTKSVLEQKQTLVINLIIKLHNETGQLTCSELRQNI